MGRFVSDAAYLDAAQRRSFALNSSIEDVLRALTERVSDRLKSERPEFSACTLKAAAHVIPLALVAAAISGMVVEFGTALFCVLTALPSAFRMLMVMSRPPASAAPRSRRKVSASAHPDLPVYTVIAALHREARVVDQLLSAIEQLDYPAAKLDLILIVEETDPETHAAITRRRHRLPITVIPAPPVGPCTKPKALNIALELARGSFVVIYDAEDRPESHQLQCALQAFRSSDDNLACVQSRLCVDTDTTWLARYFMAEYAGHFDTFLPKLAEFDLPLPLGGSSNHFRTAVLREVGGWDPYNVTEDADLGIRLARLGYRSGVIDSTTYEEAPATTWRWLRQRSRWFKGWMQTFLVHMRDPYRLLRELGPSGLATFLFIVGGNALVALAHPLFVVGFLWHLSFGSGNILETAAYAVSIVIGYVPSAFLAWCGLGYRGVRGRFRILIWTPLHWLLLSAAAWWAAFELIAAPSRWNKTEHGADKSNVTSSLLRLSLHLADLEKRGELPHIWIDATYGAVNRQQPLPVSA